MTIILDGTAGIANNATDLSYTGTLTGSTGVLNIGSGQVYKDASGNVGIGTSSPSTPLQVTTALTGANVIRVTNGTQVLNIGLNNGSGGSYIFESSNNALRFGTNDTERARIDSSGNLLMGTTTTSYGSISGKFTSCSATSGSAGLFYTGFSGDVSTSALNIGKFDNNSTTSQIFVKFGVNNAGTGSGQINANGGGAAAFGSFSDRRLKENIEKLGSQLSNICALNPVEFDYKTGGHQIGFIAQDMQEVYPDAVGENSDGLLSITGWSKTEARLVKAIQEQQALIAALTTRITALEAK